MTQIVKYGFAKLKYRMVERIMMKNKAESSMDMNFYFQEEKSKKMAYAIMHKLDIVEFLTLFCLILSFNFKNFNIKSLKWAQTYIKANFF